MSTVTALDAERVETLAAAFSGALFQPGDEHYDEVRRVHNGLIDKTPALIARCLGTSDVVAACTIRLRYTSSAPGESVNGRAGVSTMSGFPSCHPSGHRGAGGRSAALPSFMPPSTHRRIVSI